LLTTKQTSQFYNVSSGLNSHHGLVIVVAWRKFGKRFKEIVLESFVPHKIQRKNPDPEYQNREVKRFKVKVRRVYNKRKFGQR
jgi:hypothetical protein